MSPGWWRTAVVYQVYVRSFSDGDGDGVGDLRGLVERLDALTRLGVDALWLTPIYRSPQTDHGYDVSDPRDVDPLFGDLALFDRLVEQAHAVGLKIVLDLVPNHVSDQHPWFRQAVADGPRAPSRARFHIVPGGRPPTRWRSMFGGSAWSRLPDGEWYLHLFAPEQPDLDWSHPDVRADAEETLRFWVARGVDGFRVDVAGGLTKDRGYAEIRRDSPVHPHWDRPETHEIYRSWRTVLDAAAPDVYAVAEAWGSPDRTAAFARSDELGQVFAFEIFRTRWSAASLRRTIHEQLRAQRSVDALPAWVVGNHDVSRASTRLGPARSLALHLFLLAMPGAFYLYAGDELGLPEVEVPRSAWQDPQSVRSAGRLPNRDGARVPLPWTSSAPSFGFTTGRPWLPMPPELASHARDVQEADPASAWSVLHRALVERPELWVKAPARVDWLPAPPGILVAQRGTSIAVLNASSRAWPVRRLVPTGHTVVATSAPSADAGVVPPSACVWLRA